MKQKVSQKLICGLLVSFSALVAVFLPTTSLSDESQNLVLLSNTILQPGDVINFKDGWGAFLGVGEYGHTGMYLGKDPDTRNKVFLDFTTTKKGRNPKEFKGRISSEEVFLNDNINHKEFNVYRLNGVHRVNQKILLETAKDIARNKTFGAFIDCANAASRALSAASGLTTPIVVVRPDGFADDFRFDAVSLTVSIKDALAEKIRQNEHDKRLSETYIDLATRSCANPGSVTQAELDSLPEPYQTQYYLARTPDTLGDCITNVYLNLGGRAVPDAEEVRKLSAPKEEPIAIQAVPQNQEARPIPPPAFSTVLPQLKEFAMTACSAPEQVPLERILYQPYNFSYREYDDNLAKNLSVGLGDCPRQLFNQLIATIRAVQWTAINRQWIRTTVASYSRTPDTSSGNTAPPSGGGEIKPPPPAVHDPEGDALKRLREIERRKRWGLPPR